MAPQQQQHGAPASAFALALASTAEAASKEATTAAAPSAVPRLPGAAKSAAKAASTAVAAEEPMPTDKLLDVSPLALRMSSPFNAGYWLAAAA